MKRIIFIITLFVAVAAYAPAQEKFQFKFNKDGKFKIAQFTDIHWVHGEPTCEKTVATIKAVLAAEKPDLAILTGDVAYKRPERDPWTEIPKIFEEAKTPFAVVFGNHDGESSTKISRSEIMDILSKSPYFVGEKGQEDIHGCGNYVLPVQASKSAKVSALLYCFDSNAYATNPKYGTYAPIYFDQIAWYRQQSEKFTAANGGNPLPALAFFHIPLPEYNNIIGKKNTVGTHGEKPGPPDYNTGLFGAFIEKQDVMGTFVGHDHNNDYIGIEYYIALAYGRVSGWEAYGDKERGARIISLYENESAFDTWIRTPQGTELAFYFPSGISSVDEETMTYLPAKKGKPAKQGIRYTYYEGDFGSVKKITPDKKAGEGTMNYFSVNDAPAKDYFAYDFRTWIKIPEKGVYSFYTISDDGSQLYIDDQLVVDKDWSHIVRMDGKVALEAGFHELKVLYYEANWGQSLEIGYSSKKIRDQKLPENSLFIPEK
ncbi:MAG: metallophosphoesterase [Tannerella sp.]|jgi:predicted phosphodiesterase|nr:metallophosphoesterase [Tannerella sp.]